MTRWEWLAWRLHLRRQRKRCARYGHWLDGPHLALGGHQVYACRRCAFRLPASKVVRSRVLP